MKGKKLFGRPIWNQEYHQLKHSSSTVDSLSERLGNKKTGKGNYIQEGNDKIREMPDRL